MGQYLCTYLVWALCQLSQTDALFSPWVAALSHTQSSGDAPPPRLKPKESTNHDIFEAILMPQASVFV